MAKILIHSTHGPEAPTQADRAFLIARTAIQEGHKVSLFLAGAAVELIRDEHLDSVLGITGESTTVGEWFDAIISGGGRFYLSEMSCEARGITEEDLRAKDVESAAPNVLIRLTVENDRVITYG
jgi:predicted peroxiredoxin